MSDDIIKRLREALAAGPTPGEWVYLFGDRFVYTRLEDGCRGTPVVNADCLFGEAHFSTLQFVAACNPVAIRALFDRLDAAERERDSKAAELANLQVAFSDWKVFHSTARLEAENERLREDAERLDSGCIRLVDRDDFGESVATVYAQVDLRAAIDAARREE